MISEATKANLRRKSAFVDQVQLHEGVPLFSWVDLSLTELCNRSGPATAGHKACVFCPRIDPAFYPNQNLNMSMELVDKIMTELTELRYKGTIVLCGYGEPLLHPEIGQIVRRLKNCVGCRVEIVTNGDFLGPEKIRMLLDQGLDYFVVSLYDGPHQLEKLNHAFRDAGVLGTACEETYLLRDRWHTEADQFGLKLTNRAGTA
jgi:uncharacterized Fe-S cluster-containing radical SAM superfamily enzyme